MSAAPESLPQRSALGVRFWDQAGDRQIDPAGLSVTLQPSHGRGPVIEAVRTPSGLCSFHGLPGLRDFEYGLDDAPTPRDFLLCASDPSGRFLPYAHQLALPASGGAPYWSGLDADDPDDAPPGIYLFSAPARAASPATALFRGELWDSAAGQAAAHAVVEVAVDGVTLFGIADQRGCFAVQFPYPAPALNAAEAAAEDAAALAERPVGTRAWAYSLRVRFDFSGLQAPTGAAVPDHSALFNQPYATLLIAATPGDGSAAETTGRHTGTLTAGRPVTLKTESQSRLLLHPPG